MPSVLAWPRRLPDTLDGLYAAVSSRLPAELGLEEVDDLSAESPAAADRGAAVIVVDDNPETLAAVAAILHADAVDVVLVVGDAFLGSDAQDLRPSQTGGAAVAAVRSKATRRGATHRANVVCIAGSLVGAPSSQRGPLAHSPAMTDVADAVAFLVDADNAYLNGQVLFVNGGRHLFSSMSS